MKLKISAQVERLFVQQCIDHSVSLLFSMLLFAASLSVVDHAQWSSFFSFNAAFWLGLVSLLFTVSFFYRMTSFLMFGQSLGEKFSLLAAPAAEPEPSFKEVVKKHFIESVELSMPALWLADFLLRNYFVSLEKRKTYKKWLHEQSFKLG